MTLKEEKIAARKKRRGKGENFSLWLSSEQKTSLLDRTRVSGAPSPSAFIKSRIFDADYEPSSRSRHPVAKADPALIRQLAWIGNNVNQVARACNRSRALSPEQAASIYASLALIAEELEAISEAAQQ